MSEERDGERRIWCGGLWEESMAGLTKEAMAMNNRQATTRRHWEEVQAVGGCGGGGLGSACSSKEKYLGAKPVRTFCPDGGGPQRAVSEADTERPRGRCRAAYRITYGGVGPGYIHTHLEQSIKVPVCWGACRVPIDWLYGLSRVLETGGLSLYGAA